MADELDAIPIRKIKQSSLKRGTLIIEGGFARLYNAAESGRPVVLRVLKDQFRFSCKRRARFHQGVEVRRNCGQHPNIVQYRAEGGGLLSCPFEVIEHINGKDLKRLIFDRDNRIIDDPVNILRQCAAAMMHIHQIGWLHLDIKPENYLVQFIDNKPNVKLTDFDLCLPVGAKEAPKSFGGSLMYLAPEYLTGKEISIASDIFAFGVMAFNLCTGEMPFLGSVESMIRSGGYKISFPQSIGNRVTPRIQEFILRCLAEKPGDRFADGGELFVNLEQVLREDAKEAQRAKLGI